MTRRAALFIFSVGSVIATALFILFQRFPMMPVLASHEGQFVDRAYNGLGILSIVMYSGLLAALIYSFLFHRAGPDQAEGDKFDRSRGWWVEALWVGLSLLINVALALFGSHELREIIGKPQADLDIQVNASQFSWEFFYPKQNEYGSRLVLPVGKRVRLTLTSKDVVHSFWVPEFRVKQDAVPGRLISLLMTPTREGTYELRCAELCGMDHTGMLAFVDVVPADQFEERLKGETW